MADVAKQAGTSAAVVSYVLNDGPRPVAPATKARVLAAASALGYRRNRVAAALRSGKSGLVGVVLPDTVNPYFAALGRHIETALAEAGKLTVIANSGYDATRQTAAIEAFLAAQVDGLIIIWSGGDSDPASAAHAEGRPVVYVHHSPNTTAQLVAADNKAGIKTAIAHLHTHGHKRIDFLAGATDEGPVGDRVKTWRAATTGRLLRSAYSRAAAAQLFTNLDKPPTALVVATDEQAMGVLAAAHAANINVPEQLAVISCDGSPETAFTVPPLTVVAQPFTKMAKQAVRQLLEGETKAQHPIEANLTIRRSCGCPHPPFKEGQEKCA